MAEDVNAFLGIKSPSAGSKSNPPSAPKEFSSSPVQQESTTKSPLELQSMDFKKLGKLIAILGIGILAVGVFIFGANQPVPDVVIQGSIARMFEQAKVDQVNATRGAKREDAKKAMVAGGIILFIGFALSASAKKTKV